MKKVMKFLVIWESRRVCRKVFKQKLGFTLSTKEAVSKIEISKDFDKLDIAIGSKENYFSVSYAN